MYYIYSTLAAPVLYTSYKDSQMPEREYSIRINGGAGVAQEAKITGNLYTPRGVVTLIKDSDFEFLQKNPVFKIHEKNGYITFEKSSGELSQHLQERANSDLNKINKVVDGNMKDKDISAPKTPETLPTKAKRIEGE